MPLNKLLAAVALTLALAAAFIGSPLRKDSDLPAIARLIESEEDHITPLELAEQLSAGKKVRLIDLRDSVSYNLRHIFNAERMTIEQVVNGGVKRNETVVLYSEGGTHASQAWVLLKTKNFETVLTLLGGFTGWSDVILSPVLKADASDEEKKEFEHCKALSLFFGGVPAIEKIGSGKKKSAGSKPLQIKTNPPIQFKKEEEKLRGQC